jgi:hypothetical protein
MKQVIVLVAMIIVGLVLFGGVVGIGSSGTDALDASTDKITSSVTSHSALS